MLLHTEESNTSVVGVWEATSISALKTPQEVFQSLKMEGYKVSYDRVPLTPSSVPAPSFFDQLLEAMMKATEDTVFVFNCHSGVTRSTIGRCRCGWKG